MRIDLDGLRHPTITETGIYGFFGDYRFLSNFHVCTVLSDGIVFKSSEHAYMYRKTHDPEMKAKIAAAPTPAGAKKIARSVVLREDWDYYRCIAMYDALIEKFADPVLNAKLKATGNLYLEETNNWNDKFWGVHVDAAGNKEGLNMLGKSLMLVRARLCG